MASARRRDGVDPPDRRRHLSDAAVHRAASDDDDLGWTLVAYDGAGTLDGGRSPNVADAPASRTGSAQSGTGDHGGAGSATSGGRAASGGAVSPQHSSGSAAGSGPGSRAASPNRAASATTARRMSVPLLLGLAKSPSVEEPRSPGKADTTGEVPTAASPGGGSRGLGSWWRFRTPGRFGSGKGTASSGGGIRSPNADEIDRLVARVHEAAASHRQRSVSVCEIGVTSPQVGAVDALPPLTTVASAGAGGGAAASSAGGAAVSLMLADSAGAPAPLATSVSGPTNAVSLPELASTASSGSVAGGGSATIGSGSLSPRPATAALKPAAQLRSVSIDSVTGRPRVVLATLTDLVNADKYNATLHDDNYNQQVLRCIGHHSVGVGHPANLLGR